MAAVTYSAADQAQGPSFTCSRCKRVYPYPVDGARPIRCECGWWYRNTGHGKIVEEFKPRIGGEASTRFDGPVRDQPPH